MLSSLCNGNIFLGLCLQTVNYGNCMIALYLCTRCSFPTMRSLNSIIICYLPAAKRSPNSHDYRNPHFMIKIMITLGESLPRRNWAKSQADPPYAPLKWRLGDESIFINHNLHLQQHLKNCNFKNHYQTC